MCTYKQQCLAAILFFYQIYLYCIAYLAIITYLPLCDACLCLTKHWNIFTPFVRSSCKAHKVNQQQLCFVSSKSEDICITCNCWCHCQLSFCQVSTVPTPTPSPTNLTGGKVVCINSKIVFKVKLNVCLPDRVDYMKLDSHGWDCLSDNLSLR